MIVGHTGVEFTDDSWVNDFPGNLLKDNQSVLDCDDASSGRKVVAVQWIAPSLSFCRPCFRLRFLFCSLSLGRTASPFLRFVPACCFLDLRPSILELLK